jgi:hypothetical protein
MSTQLRRRMIMAAGACIAGAAIPIAAASSAWADDIEITYDGKIVFDDFANAPAYGASDVGTAAESGTNNDWAIVEAPAGDGTTLLANDSAAGDSGDYAFYQGDNTPATVLGQEGATIANGTNSYAEVFGGGNATINDIPGNGAYDPVSNSSAIATNGGFAAVNNDGAAPGISVTNDYAYATGTATNNGAATPELGAGTTPSVAYIYDSGSSDAYANDTGSNLSVGYGGSAVDLANNSDAYAINAGSSSDIEGGVVNGVPFTNDTPISGVADYVGNGSLQILDSSSAYAIDGIPDATFFADLFGVNGATAFTTAYTDLLGLF